MRTTIVLTCGPAWEPLDGMRRLTNASTGRLGSVLGDAMAADGHRVVVFRGETSTAAPPTRVAELRSFGTNDDLAGALSELSRTTDVGVVFHAAALCDFKVAAIRGSDGDVVCTGKIPSRTGRITLELEPATKVLPRLRDWFPRARIVGWKYELNGGRQEALNAAWRQMKEAQSDACVLNGDAWGDGFAVCELPDRLIPCPDVRALSETLLRWIERGSGETSSTPA